MNEIAPIAAPTTTLIDLLRAAVDKGADVATLERLAKLYEAAETTELKKEFNNALAEAKKELRPIIKDKAVGSMYKYETMGAIAESIDPILATHGLFYTFPDSDKPGEPNKITVTCRLSHRNGYSIEASRSAPPDAGQNRNVVQAMGSTITYLQRYTLKAVLGLAVAQDKDGKQRFADRPEIREPGWSEAHPELAGKIKVAAVDPSKPFAIERISGQEWQDWTRDLLYAINAAPTDKLVEQWVRKNAELLATLQAEMSPHHAFVQREINKRLRKLRDGNEAQRRQGSAGAGKR